MTRGQAHSTTIKVTAREKAGNVVEKLRTEGTPKLCIGTPMTYFPYDLMAWNQLRLNDGKVAFNDMQVGATNSAGNDP